MVQRDTVRPCVLAVERKQRIHVLSLLSIGHLWTAQQKQCSFLQLAVFRAQQPPTGPHHRIRRPLRMAK